MKIMQANSSKGFMLISILFLSQACSGDESSSANEAVVQEPQSDSYASFTLSGALEGEKDGVAVMDSFEYSGGSVLRITITDSENEAEQSYRLRFLAESQGTGAPLEPAVYPVVFSSGVVPDAGAFDATYTHIIENRGGYYANLALEYSITLGRQDSLGGELTIESVEDGYATGGFEIMLYEKGSINNAPGGEEKQINLSNGNFRVAIPSEY